MPSRGQRDFGVSEWDGWPSSADSVPVAIRFPTDSAVRPSHVGAGILVGFAAGAVYGLVRATRSQDACAHKDCGPVQLELIADPLAYGAIGGAAGGLPMLWWRWR